jgi:hypothetical protein
VRKRERPKTQVGRGVRDAAKAEFDSVDNLVDNYVSKVMLLLRAAMNKRADPLSV